MIKKELLDLIEEIKEFNVNNLPKINQEEFDNLVNYIITNETNISELLWRLCGEYEEENIIFNNVIDYYIDNKDYSYLSELVSYVSDGINQEYLVEKVISTEDIEFIEGLLNSFGKAVYSYLDSKYLEKVLEYYNENK